MRFAILSLILIVAGLLQNSALFVIGGVKPNLILVVLLSAAQWIGEFGIYLPLVILGVLLAKFFPGSEFESLVIGLLAIVGFGIIRRSHGRPSVNNLILVSMTTIAFYLLTDGSFLLQRPVMALGEVVYNCFLGIVFLKMFQSWLPIEKDNMFHK